MALTRWRPSQGMTLRDAMQQLMEDAFIDSYPTGANLTSSIFPVDIRETQDGYEVDASIPGARPEDIEVTATGNTVMIKAEIGDHRHDDEDDTPARQPLRQERFTGVLQRAFTLPGEIDANTVDATFEHGVLCVKLPKSEATKPKRVEIHSNGNGSKTVEARSRQ